MSRPHELAMYQPCVQCQIRYVKEKHMRCVICQEGRGPQGGNSEEMDWKDWVSLSLTTLICLGLMVLVVYTYQPGWFK